MTLELCRSERGLMTSVATEVAKAKCGFLSSDPSRPRVTTDWLLSFKAVLFCRWLCMEVFFFYIFYLWGKNPWHYGACTAASLSMDKGWIIQIYACRSFLKKTNIYTVLRSIVLIVLSYYSFATDPQTNDREQEREAYFASLMLSFMPRCASE